MRRVIQVVVLATVALVSSQMLAQPANDDCVDAAPITDGDTAYTTLGATTQNPSSCGGIQSCDIWYTYTASCTGNLELSTCNMTDYDSAIAIYDGGTALCLPGPGILVGCNDDGAGCSGFSSLLTVSVTTGNIYLIELGGFNGATGTGTLMITCTSFLRGDADGNGTFDGLTDAIYILDQQFLGGPALPCVEAADANGNGALDGLADAIYLLAHGFQGGPSPPAPFPDCGADPDSATSLGCELQPGCP